MLKRTVKIKLNPTQSDKLIIEETLDVCNKAMNWISDMAWQKKCFNRVALHHLLYYELRDRFNLPSQIAISLKDKVCASYKADNSVKHTFKAKVLSLNFPRTAKLVSDNVISFKTIKGRLKVFMVLGDFQLQYLRDKSWKIRESEIVYSNHKYFLHLVVQRDEPEKITAKDTLGVDRGINAIATDSLGEKFVGTKVKKIKSRFYKLRRSLQATGTPSAKRHLEKLSGKERGFMKHVNHIISKRLVQKASRLGYRIALEDLSGIRDEDRGKLFNRMIGGWSFCQLHIY